LKANLALSTSALKCFIATLSFTYYFLSFLVYVKQSNYKLKYDDNLPALHLVETSWKEKVCQRFIIIMIGGEPPPIFVQRLEI